MTNITDKGFKLVNDGYELENLAFVSLGLALKSYFSTYYSMKNHLNLFLNDSADKNKEPFGNEKDLIMNHTKDYYESYFETIIHFQHFFELITKDILTKINKLLVVKINGKYDILYKLIKNETVKEEEVNSLQTIEFGEVLKVLSKLDNIEGAIEDRYKYLSSKESIEKLTKLNQLRNRIWHKGLYILPYNILDLFICRDILPIAIDIAMDSNYKKYEKRWKYEYIKCGINPLEELTTLYKSIKNTRHKNTLKKAAYLKELGRAAYLNIIRHEEWESREHIFKPGIQFGFSLFHKQNFDRKKNIALAISNVEKDMEQSNPYMFNYDCPVCGLNTLIEYMDDFIDDDDGKYYQWTNEVKCSCCGFNIDYCLGNAEHLGLKLENYFDE